MRAAALVSNRETTKQDVHLRLVNTQCSQSIRPLVYLNNYSGYKCKSWVSGSIETLADERIILYGR